MPVSRICTIINVSINVVSTLLSLDMLQILQINNNNDPVCLMPIGEGVSVLRRIFGEFLARGTYLNEVA